MKLPKPDFPPIGMRIIKSAAAVFICYMIYLLGGKRGIVFYTQLAVLWCIQPNRENSLKNAIQRTIGTLIGAFYGLLIVLLNYYVLKDNPSYELLRYSIISLMIIPVIYTTLVIRKKNASYFSCVVYLSIVVMHIVDENPYLFILNRVMDTMIGIFVGLLVNSAHLPREKKTDILFISGLDDTLLSTGDHLSSYSIIELNQMIDSGANFTISTMRTPASILIPMANVHLNRPVIAMDGAVLYDTKEKSYIKTIPIPYEETKELIEYVRSKDFHCFINVIFQDMLVIYHSDFKNEAENQIYEQMHTSPYRNYLYRELPEGLDCVYLMVIDQTKRIESFLEDLSKDGYTDRYKIVSYPSDDYPGYSYLKIYQKEVSRSSMCQYLQDSLGCKKTVTFGSIEGLYDYTIQPDNPNLVVKTMKKLYNPLLLPSFLKKGISD